MLNKAQGRFEFNEDILQLKVNPRIGVEIIENVSWQENDLILEMWAGLLYSSLNRDSQEDSNLIFVKTLNTLTTVQARLINHICKSGVIQYDKNGLIYSEDVCEIVLL